MIRIVSLLIMLFLNSYLDLKYKKISVLVCVIFAIEAVLLNLQSDNNGLRYVFGFVVGLVVILISKITNGAIGIGDGYVICVIGIFMGVHAVIQVLMGAFLLAAVVGIGLMIIRKVRRGMTLPFVPFLLGSVLLQMPYIQ